MHGNYLDAIGPDPIVDHVWELGYQGSSDISKHHLVHSRKIHEAIENKLHTPHKIVAQTRALPFLPHRGLFKLGKRLRVEDNRQRHCRSLA